MNELNITSIVSTILHKLWAVILAAIVFAGVAFAYCRFVSVPVYQARASLIVSSGTIVASSDQAALPGSSGSAAVSTSDITTSLYLSNNSVDILKSSEIYKDLAQSMNNKYSYHALKGAFNITHRSEDKFFIDITFKSNSPREAVEIINAFADLSSVNIKKVFPSANVFIMDYADSAGQVAPRIFYNTVLFGFFGAVLACCLIILIAVLDRTVKGEEDFKASFDIPLLGTVPDFNDVSSNRYKRSNHYYSYGDATTTEKGKK